MLPLREEEARFKGAGMCQINVLFHCVSQGWMKGQLTE